MAVTENFLKTNSCRAIPLILLPCLHCLLSCRYDVYQDASINMTHDMNQSLNFIRANRSKSGSCDDSGLSNRSINSRSIREYLYPFVEVLTVVVEVV